MVEATRAVRPTMDELESTLFSTLNSVEPDPEYVQRLSARFRRVPSTVLEQHSWWGAYLIMTSGLFLGVGLLWLFQRLNAKQQK